jgi:Transposase domain (DUF772).
VRSTVYRPSLSSVVFRPILSNLYDNRTEKGGRPNVDEVVMLKVLVLQNWYNLSDPEMEYERERSLVL